MCLMLSQKLGFGKRSVKRRVDRQSKRESDRRVREDYDL